MATDKKISYEMQGKVRNYLGKQKMVKAPLHWQSGPGHPKTQLAYITKPELDLILKKDFHGSLKNGPNVGPSGIMSLNDPGTGRSGSEMSAAETGGTGHGMSASEAAGHRSAAIAAGAQRTAKDDIADYNRSQWNERFKSYKDRKSREPKSNWGNFGRGIVSVVGGIPGRIGSFLSSISGRLRGINPVTGEPNTQEEYEAMMADKSIQGRIDSMTDRMLAGKTFSRTNLDSLLGQQQTYGATAGENFGTSLGNIDNARGSNFRGALGADKFANTVGPMSVNTNTIDYRNALGDNWATGTGIDNVTSTDEMNQWYGGAKDGGRIGYAGAGPVLGEQEDENVFEFMQDQGIPHGEMAEGPSPFDIRVQELIDTGMSWQEAWKIASQEFGQVVEGESDQGIASII